MNDKQLLEIIALEYNSKEIPTYLEQVLQLKLLVKIG
jgi:hypothetical protein